MSVKAAAGVPVAVFSAGKVFVYCPSNGRVCRMMRGR